MVNHLKEGELRISFRLRRPYSNWLEELKRDMGSTAEGEVITTSKVLREALKRANAGILSRAHQTAQEGVK